MNRALKMVIVLTLISGIVGSLLALVYAATWPKILENERKALERAIYEVIPGATRFEEETVGAATLFKGFDESDLQIGVAMKAQGTGFQGIITLMGGFSSDFQSMLGLKVLNQVETPGLGAKIAEAEFQDQFKGLSLADDIAVIKGNVADNTKGEIQAITGATISSDAVKSILNAALAGVSEKGGD